MNSYKRVGNYWVLWGLCLSFVYIGLYCKLNNISENYVYSTNLKLAGFSFPSNAQGIRLAAYEDTYSSFNETMGGIYLFPSSLAYRRFKDER